MRLAAKQGYAKAQTALGALYNDGRGVPQDYVKAYMYLDLGAASGDRLAAKLRDSLAARMTRAQIAEAQQWAEQFRPQAVAP